jgi:hypothetical protein
VPGTIGGIDQRDERRNALLVHADTNVFELRPIGEFRFCPVCLAVNSSLDARCSGCDAVMPALKKPAA